MSKTVFYYAGTKAGISPYIAPLVQKDTLYIEPFSGSFACGFALLKQGLIKEAVLNDINKDTINFWSCLKDDYEKLAEAINAVQSGVLRGNDVFFNAAITWFTRRLNRGKIGLLYYTNTVAEVDVKSYTSLFKEYADLLQHVQITCVDYTEIMKMYPDAFLYLDPPYLGYCNKGMYGVNWGYEDAIKLNGALKQHNGNWVMSHSIDPNIRALYREHNIDYIELAYSTFIAKEMLIMKGV